MTDLARLRQLAEAATPGEWRLVESDDVWDVRSYGDGITRGLAAFIADVPEHDDAAYIAAFNPTTAAALLDEIESLRRATGTLMDHAVLPHEYKDYYLVRRTDYQAIRRLVEGAATAALLEAEPLDPEGAKS